MIFKLINVPINWAESASSGLYLLIDMLETEQVVETASLTSEVGGTAGGAIG